MSAKQATQRLQHRATRLRSWVLLAVIDLALVAICFAAVLLLAYSSIGVPPHAWDGYLAFLPMAAAVYVLAHALFGLYGRVWRYAGVDEARRVLVSGAIAGAVVTTLSWPDREVPHIVAVGGAVFTTMLVGATRFQARLFAFRRRAETSGTTVIVLGAGSTGAMLVRQMRESRRLRLRPVAILDDDPVRRGRSLIGVPVAGTFDDLVDVARRFDADQAVLAVPDAPRALVRRMADLAERAGVALRVLPEPDAVQASPVGLPDLRNLAIEDLLGRGQVSTDLGAVSALVAGRRVLVTGGGGSIGSEIARQVARLGPAELVVLDHDETHLHETLGDLGALGGAVEPTAALCDVRDPHRLGVVFDEHRPDVVFHAAAHKHVPMLERHAVEAVMTNVFGTRHVVEAAQRVGTRHLVLISTDKAVRAKSVMGASKRIAEHILVRAAVANGRPWCAVRFGNVLGSRGSVVPTFASQIAHGGPVTVTDPRMTRYFMSIPEAVALVIQAAAFSEGGDLFMLDMGEPVRIVDLARRMVRLAGLRVGDDIELRITGLRPGEKLHEELSTPEEGGAGTAHPSVLRLRPRPFHAAELENVLERLSSLTADLDDQRAAASLLEAANRQPAAQLVPAQRSIDGAVPARTDAS